eukprot:SAG31_NODE_6901_length_1857_cov_1.932878_1_plen_511_part_01
MLLAVRDSSKTMFFVWVCWAADSFGHFFSEHAITWRWSWQRSYWSNVKFSNGSTIYFASRQRPHFVSNRSGQPVRLLNGASHNVRTMGNDYSFTRGQPLGRHQSITSEKASLKSDDLDYRGFRHSGTPGGVPVAADCALRALAGRFFAHHQPASVTAAHATALHDALQLDVCGVSRPTPDAQQTPGRWSPTGGTVVEVDSVAGSDAGGGQHKPFQTIAAAVAFVRSRTKPATVLLRGGTHRLLSALQLDARDSGLTIQNSPGQRATISGGKRLRIAPGGWRPSSACAGCFAAHLGDQVRDIVGLRLEEVREIRARYPDFDAERGGVAGKPGLVHDGVDGWIRAGTSWICAAAHTAMNGINGSWPPHAPAITHLSNSSDWPGVEWPDKIETDGKPDPPGASEPVGAMATATSSDFLYVNCGIWFTLWASHALRSQGLPAIGSDGEGAHGNFWIGTGGTCVDRAPPAGYWCAPRAPRDIGVPNHPLGVYVDRKYLPNAPPLGYQSPEGAVVHG